MNRSTSAVNRSRPGQSSLEFTAMMIMALLIFAGFYSFFVDRQVRAVENERQTTALSIVDRVSFNMDLALTQGSGFRRDFELQEDLGGVDYNITLGNGTVLIEYRDKMAVSDTAVNQVSGTAEPGKNIVRNDGGVITVSQP